MAENDKKPAPSTRTFRGWIPTITGLLSFNVIGEAKSRTDTVCGRASINDCRYLACYQYRHTSDVPLRPRWLKELITSITGNSGEFVFLCIACDTRYSASDALIHPTVGADETKLQGTIFVFPAIKRESWSFEISLLADRTIEQLQDLAEEQRRRDFDTYSSPPDEAEGKRALECEDSIRKLCALAKRQAMFMVFFDLLRNGICTFTVDDNVTELPNFHTLGDRPSSPSSDREAPSYVLELTQSFMFLKDISHHHRHHPSSSDNLTRLYPYDATPGRRFDDVWWRRRTLQVLYRHVTDLRRNEDEASLSNAKGFLAYARSFAQLSRPVIDGKSNVAAAINLPELDASIEAASQSSTLQTARSRYLRSSFIASVIGSLALVLATISLLEITNYEVNPFELSDVLGVHGTQEAAQSVCKASGYAADSCPWIVSLAHWVLETPTQFVGALLSCFLVAWLALEYQEFSQKAPFRLLIYAAHAFRRDAVGWTMIIFASALALFAFFYVLVPPALLFFIGP